jgi:multidrug efflux pump subunit AcrB
MTQPVSSESRSGGIAQYIVEHREVGWMALIVVLVWGIIVYGKLGQQEDPTIPHRTAMLVTAFPGATASKVEELISKPVERKISELQSIEEIKSESRPGVSVVTIKMLPASKASIDQEWDKLRSKLREVTLPQGAREPFLNTDFGNTVTLLFALVSPPISDAECMARANLLRDRLGALRAGFTASHHAAVAVFFPPAIAQDYREVLAGRFETAVRAAGLATNIKLARGQAFVLADLETAASRSELERLVASFTRTVTGTDQELYHPDFTPPILLLDNEDPLPQIRATAPPRYSYRTLELLARDCEDALKQIASVGKVTKVGIVPETVYLLFSDANVAGYGLTPESVISAIAHRNAVIPGGTLHTEGHNFPVQLSGEFQSEKDMPGTVVGVNAAGAPIYLRDLFEVRRMYESPIPFKVDVLERTNDLSPLDTRRSVMVAVEMRDGRIIRQFNEDVGRTMNAMKERMPEGMEVRLLSDQPTAVAHRIHHFARCFLEAVVIVIIVALFLMDWRSALVVATAIPLTIAMTLVGMYMLNIPLQQISIAGLIIALGMLVDVPVVASDGINRELYRGEPPLRAAWLGPLHLRHPMVFGTLINIVAFLPLLLLSGDKGVFMRSLPQVVTLALLSALLVSVTFTPLVGYYILRGQKGFDEGAEIRSFFLFRWVDQTLARVLPHYRAALQGALRHPWPVVGGAYLLLLASFLLVPRLGTQFFPPAERNQLLVDVELPTTDSLRSLRTAVDQVVTVVKQHDEVASAAVFSGGTAPRFYYNVVPKESASYLAQILINTRGEADVPRLLVKLRGELDHTVPGVRSTVKQLEQGVPVGEPIQIRISGDNLDELRGLADQAAAVVRSAGGYHVFDDLGLRMPNLQIDIDNDRANSIGVGNVQVGMAAQAAFAGLKVTELREGDRLIPVVIRNRIEDRSEAEKIRSLYVQTATGKSVPLAAFSDLKLQPEFVTIPHYNQLRTVTVKAYAPFGELPSRVLDRSRPGLAKIHLPAGYQVSIAGEDKELRQNQEEMGTVMKVSLVLIAVTMIAQFGSVAKSVVVMLTVPLGIIGALLGLTFSGSPLGFTALLGIVSLAGVNVSHIIVLSDFIEKARARGLPLEEALVQAGLARLRPVLVTVFATVGGLLPLFLTGGALWHPLTAVHICGLLLATVLTLVLLPVIYYLFATRLKLIK